MNHQELLQEISDYCRKTGLAESTFGRRAVNDGKLAARLRNGGRITTYTLDRIRSFMDDNRAEAITARPPIIERPSPPRPITARPALAGQRAATRSAISVSSTTGRNICCSSTPAAKSG